MEENRQFASPLADSTSETPKLYRPGVVASWSILLTPLFGAVLVALNWRALGVKSNRSRYWVIGLAIYEIIFLGIFDSDLALGALPLVLIAWYYHDCRAQMRYLKENRSAYIREKWLPALAWGAYCNFVVIVLSCCWILQANGPILVSFVPQSRTAVLQFMTRERMKPMERKFVENKLSADEILQMKSYQTAAYLLTHASDERLQEFEGQNADGLAREILIKIQEGL